MIVHTLLLMTTTYCLISANYLSILESQDLPRQPQLELCLGQTLQCIKLMAKSGLGACAFTNLDEVLRG